MPLVSMIFKSYFLQCTGNCIKLHSFNLKRLYKFAGYLSFDLAKTVKFLQLPQSF